MGKISKKEWIRTLKFTLFSISAGVIQFGTFALFAEVFNIVEWLSNAMSMFLSVLWNFTVNRKLTFKSANNIKIAMLLVALFYAIFLPLSSLFTEFANNIGIHALIVEIIVMLLNFVLEFLYCRFIVYRNSCDTAVDKNAEKNNKLEQKEENVQEKANDVQEERITL